MDIIKGFFFLELWGSYVGIKCVKLMLKVDYNCIVCCNYECVLILFKCLLNFLF